MSYLLEQRRTLSFRRLPFAAKRRRARPVLAILRRAGRLVLVLSPVAALAVWLLFSPRFRLAELRIEGATQVETEWIREQFGGLVDSNLLLIDLAGPHRRLQDHPWIGSVRLRKDLPDRLEVSVREHRPAAVLRDPAGASLLSPRGERIVPLEDPPSTTEGSASGRLASLPLSIESERATDSAHLGRIIELGRRLGKSPVAWARRPVAARVLTSEDVEMRFADAEFGLRLRSGPESIGEIGPRIATLDLLLPQLRDRLGRLETVDLRFDGRLVVAPASGSPADSPRTGDASNESWMSSPTVAQLPGG